MGYEHTNSRGVLYYLHSVKSPQNKDLYYFSKTLKEERHIDLPDHLEIIESKRSGLPVVKKKSV